MLWRKPSSGSGEGAMAPRPCKNKSHRFQVSWPPPTQQWIRYWKHSSRMGITCITPLVPTPPPDTSPVNRRTPVKTLPLQLLLHAVTKCASSTKVALGDKHLHPMFWHPHCLWVQEVQTNSFTYSRVQVSPPPHGILIAEPVFIEW